MTAEAAKKAEAKRTGKVGDVVKAGRVTFPNGSTRTTRGTVVLDQAGVFLIDGTEVTVK